MGSKINFLFFLFFRGDKLRNKNGFVYFINCNNKGIKIGYTKNDPMKRLKQLQTGCLYDLQLLYIIDNADYETEQYYHRYFSSMYNIRGEYYDYNFVMKWIKKDKLTKQVLKQEGILS